MARDGGCSRLQHVNGPAEKAPLRFGYFGSAKQ